MKDKYLKEFVDEVKSLFPKGATKIIVGCSTEYNDENTTVHGYSYIEVYDAKEKMMLPKMETLDGWRGLLSGGRYSDSVFENPHEDSSDEWYEWCPPSNVTIMIQ